MMKLLVRQQQRTETVNGSRQSLPSDKNTSSSSRCSEAEIRRAAGSKSLARLQAAVESGWTAHELDTSEAFTVQGKSALQMAAWKGSLENVRYLVEQVGCNVNAYSQAPFSYGKTPIFFAATQTRPEIVEYLLRQPGIHVAIVNNKGQSVLSLAATHEMPHLLPLIQKLEEGQEWWNFRKSHSDGLEYGDLDPRFVDRSLRETDLVTDYAINPTNSQTRKGGFARRNPEAAKEKLHLRNDKQGKKTCKPAKQQRPSTSLSIDEDCEWNEAWIRLEGVRKDENMTTSSGGSDHLYEAALLTIVRLGEKRRCPWMPRLIEQIAKFLSTSSIDDWDSILRRTKASARQYDNPDRLEALLDKLIRRLRSKDPNGKTKYDGVKQSSNGTESTGEQTSKRSSTSRKWKSSIRQAKELLQSELGRQVCQSLSTLSIRQGLEFDDTSILRLAVPPTFVNSTKQFLELQEELSQATVVAIDTEWHDAKNEFDQPDHGRIRGVEVSTFQIAFLASHRENETLTYVIDIKQQRPQGASIDDDNYWTLVRDLIASILENPRQVVLGFSVGHDLPVLELFIGRKLQPTSLLDLQTILANNHDQSGSSLPGLKACAAYYSQVPLSKEHQMSDWGRRPLSQPQLNYGGLDAAILLFLLAEYNASTLK